MENSKIKTFQVEDKNIRIDHYLSSKISDISRTKIKKLILDNKILVNKNPVKPSYILSEGERILCDLEVVLEEPILEPEKMNLDVVYEDDYFIVINKPAGLVVHPGNGNESATLVNGLLHHFKNLSNTDTLRPGIVHRLDKDTSGIIIVAKDNRTHQLLSDLFQDRKINKSYQAIVWGKPNNKGEIRNLIKRDIRNKTAFKVSSVEGKEAVTKYQLLDSYGPLSTVILYPKTGRTHQIRVHMKHIGSPIFADDKYSGGIQNVKSFHTDYSQLLKRTFKIANRHMLHALSISFIHPFTNKKMSFSADIPLDMKKVIKLWMK
tara:strand:- start:338 stop:1297 length:960 start_codon:yes stop_codon:yes gene_type:complete